uniref:uncharacterized protein LOC120334540 n=1 Tax=Styela clava TaxID=7725 RepID=UPI001939D63F|nr:uncharacterized protein LOC120334540 [Styela clava]
MSTWDTGGFKIQVLAIFFIYAIDIVHATSCEGMTSPKYLTTSRGNITSPRYPFEIPSSQRCEWVFQNFGTDDILLIKIHEMSLGDLLSVLFLNFVTMPNGFEIKGERKNECIAYGENQTISRCSENVKNALKFCSYHKIDKTKLPPKLRFRSSSVQLSKNRFSLSYEILQCRDHLIDAVTTGSPPFDSKPYIIIPSALAILIFIIAGTMIGMFIVINRSNHPSRDRIQSVDNVYESPLSEPMERANTYDSIRVPADLNREDMASYLSHRQLVQYPQQPEEKKERKKKTGTRSMAPIPEVDGYIDIQPLTGNAPQPNNDYATMRRSDQ